MIAFRFRTMYRNQGLTRPDVAKLLHVSERTLHNWETGHHEIPYSAYKLLRLLTHQELPGPAWAGWHMHSGKLWTPEGFGFTPDCQSWWSLLVRQARLFREMVERERQVAMALKTTVEGPVWQPQADRRDALASLRPVAADAPDRRSRAVGEADRPNLLLEHFRKYKTQKAGSSLEKPVIFDLSKVVTIPCYENGGQL